MGESSAVGRAESEAMTEDFEHHTEKPGRESSGREASRRLLGMVKK